MQPLISVIVPSYGSEEYLPRSLSSLLAARAKVGAGKVEIIVGVDPKAGHHDLEVAAELLKGEEGAFAYLHDHRLGLPLARLDGAKKAKGQYICSLDSDDYVEPSYFEVLVPLLEKERPDVVGFSFNYELEGKKRSYPFASSFIGDGERMLKAMFTDIGTRGFIWAKCWRKDLFLAYDGPLYSFLEDVTLNAILLPKAKKAIAIRDRLLVYQESNPSSLTTRKDPERFYKHVRALAAIRAYYDLHGMEKEKKILVARRWRHALSLLYAKKRAKKDGMGRSEMKKAARLFRAAMDLRRPLFESAPDFEEVYRAFPFFSSSEE